MPPRALPRRIAPLSASRLTKSSEPFRPVVDTADPVDVAAQLRKGREHLADAVNHLPPPIGFDDQSIGIHAVLVGKHHRIGVEAELAADDRVVDDVVVVDDREDRRVGERLVAEQQALRVVEPRGHIVPVVQALEIDLRDAIGLEPAVEIVEAPEGIVGLGENVPAPVCNRDSRANLPSVWMLPRKSPSTKLDDRRYRRPIRRQGRRCRRRSTARWRQLPSSRVPAFSVIHRREGEVVVVGEGEIVGDLDRVSELIGVAVARHEEAGLPLHRRVGHLEPGDVDDRHAQEVEDRVLEGDGGLIALVRDLAGANPPGGRLARICPRRLCKA